MSDAKLLFLMVWGGFAFAGLILMIPVALGFLLNGQIMRGMLPPALPHPRPPEPFHATKPAPDQAQ